MHYGCIYATHAIPMVELFFRKAGRVCLAKTESVLLYIHAMQPTAVIYDQLYTVDIYSSWTGIGYICYYLY